MVRSLQTAAAGYQAGLSSSQSCSAVPADANPILTLVEMIDALRVYEAAREAARGVDETIRRAVNDVGRRAQSKQGR